MYEQKLDEIIFFIKFCMNICIPMILALQQLLPRSEHKLTLYILKL